MLKNLMTYEDRSGQVRRLHQNGSESGMCVCGCKHKVVSSDRHFKIVFIVKYECILDRLSGHKQIKAFKE